MAKEIKIRSFQDRGTMRFRSQDIHELARQRGAASDTGPAMGEALARSPQPKAGPRSPQPKSPGPKGGPKSPPKSGPKTPPVGSPKSPAPKADIFDFAVESGAGGAEEDFGLALFESPSGPGSKKPDSKKPLLPKPPSPKPQPPAGSDSEVRLVAEGTDLTFAIGTDSGPKVGSDSDVKLVGQHSDSDVKMVQDPGLPRTPPVSPRVSGLAGQATPPVAKKSGLGPPPSPDSGVRLVPMDSDSDVKIVGAPGPDVPLGEAPPKSPSDSDIRLEAPPMSRSDEGMLTEEINLDEEIKKQEAKTPKPQAKVKPKSKLPFPQTSPFELSESGMNLKPADSAAKKPDSSDVELTPKGAKPDSSDFDLKAETGSDSGDDFSLEVSDEGLSLSDSDEAPLKGPSSGISLSNPVDAGISLEEKEGSDELEFELTLDEPHSTPKPASPKPSTPKPSTPKPAAAPDDSDSEFELSLDVDDSSGEGPSLEVDSDSEFELTLDDSGSLAPLQTEEEAPQLKAKPKTKMAPAQQDIFDSDFEVPGLEDESGSQVAALETDLDSSDFDLALGDSDIAVEDESGSQVVALDDEEEEAPAPKKKTKAKVAAEDEDFGTLTADEDEEVEEEVEEEEDEDKVREVVREKVVKAAPWGIMPVLTMLPCVVVMVLVSLMGFEMVQHMTGYKPPGFLTKTLSEMIVGKTK